MDVSYTSFTCPQCQTDIQASLDMIGQEAECPACGRHITIPDSRTDDVVRHGSDEADAKSLEAMKRRTIRIELDDI